MDTLLVIGSGGREHALAWKLAQSPDVGRIFVAPGNGGTAAEARCENVAIDPLDFTSLTAFARREAIALAVVGPETPLAAGIIDAFAGAGIPAFGPPAAAARLEGSKAFARAFMARHGIPSPAYRVFGATEDALAFLQTAAFDVVVKASGLAAGKGVVVPESRLEAEEAVVAIMRQRQFGAAGDEVVIEERLQGQEVSVLAFVDGRRWALMPLAQDHKQVFDGDRGPNTGGMGVYAPAPLLSPEETAVVEESVLRPVVEGMAAAGTPYRGVLYTGLMLTAGGPKVLEFNCRFGDPETEVLLPLLDGDLYAILQACVAGRLHAEELRWSPQAAACIIAAAPGYPGDYPKNLPIRGAAAAEALPGLKVFHAGTALAPDGSLRTSGGRVLAVTAVGVDKQQALDRAYAGIGMIDFPGMHYRRDIGSRT